MIRLDQLPATLGTYLTAEDFVLPNGELNIDSLYILAYKVVRESTPKNYMYFNDMINEAVWHVVKVARKKKERGEDFDLSFSHLYTIMNRKLIDKKHREVNYRIYSHPEENVMENQSYNTVFPR